MDFEKLREKSVKIGKNRISSKKIFGYIPEYAGCIPLAVVKMTTANEINPTLSVRHPTFFIISDLSRIALTQKTFYYSHICIKQP